MHRDSNIVLYSPLPSRPLPSLSLPLNPDWGFGVAAVHFEIEIIQYLSMYKKHLNEPLFTKNNGNCRNSDTTLHA